MSANDQSMGRRPPEWRSSAWKIASIYAVVSGLWILLSDTVLAMLVESPQMLEAGSIIKGWFFVAVTSIMLWVFIQGVVSRISKSQDEIRKSEEYFRGIFDGVNEAIFIHDPETGDIRDVNETASAMFGYSRRELLRMSVEDLLPRTLPSRDHAIDLIRRGGENPVAAEELQMRRGDGSFFSAEVNAKRLVIDGMNRLLVTVRDITSRKKTLGEIRKLHKAIEQSAASVVITDVHGVIEYANEATCRLTGCTREELVGRKPEIFNTGRATASDYNNFWKTIISGKEWRGEALNQKKDGTAYWESASISAIMDDQGKVSNFLAVREDITERRKSQEKLIHQEALLEEAGEIAHVGGWEYDPVSGRGNWSAEVARIHDCDPAEVPSKALALSFYQGENRRLLETALNEAMNHGTPYDLELELVTRAGNSKWVRTIGRPIVREGKVLRVRGSIQDITERKLAEEELRESKLRLRALLAHIQETREEERTRIAREVHDVLGQLLTGMKMDLNWLERRLPGVADSPLRTSMSEKIASITELTDSMVESVQKIARDLRPSVLDNLGLISALQSEARQFGDRTGITCEFTRVTATDHLPMEVATQVFRIFQEILTNIARHAGARHVRISIARENAGLSLTVDDDGCGIDPEKLNAPDSLGLLGMSERAGLIGGSVKIGPVPGGGTRVNLTVPEAVPCSSLNDEISNC